MKLLKNQYQDILHALADFDVEQEKLFLVKKKGRVKIHIEGIDSTFEFFLRKSVSLSKGDHQWKKLEHYELNIDGKPKAADDWNEVVSHLKRWLSVVSSYPEHP